MRAAAAVLLLAAANAGAEVVVIRGGRVYPVSGPVIERGTVVLVDGKIAAVGADVPAPPGATVVDATGKHVYPGLIDGLTTLGLTEIGSVSGSVDVAEVGDVNPHAQVWVALNPHSELFPVARANGVTAALAAPGGGLISGQSAVIRLAGSTPDAVAVRTPAAMHAVYPTGRPVFDIARMFDEPERKTFEEREKDKKKNQEKELRRLAHLLENAKAHRAGLDTADGRKTDLALEALAPVARGEVPLAVRADDEDDIRGAIAFARERGLKLIVTGGLEAWRCADALKAAGAAVLLNVDRLPRREADPYDAAYSNAATLHAAGVPFAIVTDDASQSRNLPYEAAMARAFGLPADAALRAITLSPAEILGVAPRMGSLEPGKDANVVVATGDIMDHRTSVTHVFIDGVAQPLDTRHTHLYEQFKNRK